MGGSKAIVWKAAVWLFEEARVFERGATSCALVRGLGVVRTERGIRASTCLILGKASES